MNKAADWSLRTRIRQLALVPVTVIAVLLVSYFLVERFAALGDELDASGHMMARQLAPASEYGVISGNLVILAALLDPLLREPDVVAVIVRDAEGKVILARNKAEPGRPDALRESTVRRFREPILRQIVAMDALDALAGVGAGQAPQALGEVEVVLSTAGIVERQQEVLLQALFISVLVLGVTLVIASRVAESVVRIEEARVSAEHASHAKSEFLAMMSHELRTPMNGVLGMLELMEDTELDGDQRHYLDTARVSSEHLLVVINDILDFSRIEGGRLTLEQIAFDLAEMLEKTVGGFSLRAASRDIALRLDIDPALRGLVVHSDPTRLRQVLVNLIGNAVKFTEHGGVTVRAEGRVAGSGRLALVLSVEDTGIGIPSDRLEQVFEPFRQADNSTSRRYGGTGLGLAIARRLTTMLGGVLEVDSTEGVGTCFRLRFEMAAEVTAASLRRQPMAVHVPARVASALAGRRVLLVEDNQVSQMVAQGMLHSLGMVVDTVDDGAAALEQLQRTRYDVVLMDLHMPQLDGVSATRRLREWAPEAGGDTPVVAVTANALSGEKERCLEAGMDAYIAKPYRREALRSTLAVVLGLGEESPDNEAPVPGQSLAG